MTLNEILSVSNDAMAAHLRSQTRTVSVEEAARIEAAHDANDFTPAERLPFDTGSMRRFGS